MRPYTVFLRLALLLPICLISLFPQTTAPAKAILEGDVLNASTNAPIAGARARLSLNQAVTDPLHVSDPLYLVTDKEGHFHFADLAPGMYMLSVQGVGYLDSVNTQIDLRPPRPTPANVVTRTVVYPPATLAAPAVNKSTDADGTLRVKASVPLTAYAVISGTVTDPYGQPMADAPVELLTKRPPRSPGVAWMGAPVVQVGGTDIAHAGTARTNEQGEFRIARLQPGTYFVIVNKAGGQTWANWESNFRTTYFPHATDLAAANPLDLTPGQQFRADMQIVRQPGVRLAGRLIRPPGSPNPTISVGNQIIPSTYTRIAIVAVASPLLNSTAGFTIGADNFVLRDVLPGQYTLSAETTDALGDPYGVNRKPLFGLIREIQVGEKDMPDLDLDLQPLRDLSGVVTFAAGCAASPVHIRVQNMGPLGGRQVEATSGPDGKFVLSGLTTGRLTVGISMPSNPMARQPVSIRLDSRDVLKDGFEMPYAGDEPLRIEMDCTTPRRQP